MKITGVIRSATEITGCEGVLEFSGVDLVYSREMNKLAGERIELTLSDSGNYKYYGINYKWKAEWLKDIQEEIDWSQIKQDAQMVVWSNKPPKERYYRHFAEYKDGKIYCWSGGCTSWSVELPSGLDMEVWDNAIIRE